VSGNRKLTDTVDSSVEHFHGGLGYTHLAKHFNV